MAENTHGGYRKPANPAPVSGPGAHSARTDGQVISTAPGQGYGDAKQQALQQQTAPMGSATPLPTPPPPAAGPASQPVPTAPPYAGGGIADPTAQPDQPVTHGVNLGPGAGADALHLGPYGPTDSVAPAQGDMTKLLTSLSGSDTTGVLATLLQQAAAHNA